MSDTNSRSIGLRIRLLLEAGLPVLLIQLYAWILPLLVPERSRLLDVGFGGLLALLFFGLYRRLPPSPRERGLGPRARHRESLPPLAFLTVTVVLLLFLGGWLSGRLRLRLDLIEALLLYPFWGALQQVVVFWIIYPRCRRALGPHAGITVTALLFGLAHAPNPLLLFGGALLVGVYGLIWERTPSLPLTALSHGLIGAICNKGLHVSMRIGVKFLGE